MILDLLLSPPNPLVSHGFLPLNVPIAGPRVGGRVVHLSNSLALGCEATDRKQFGTQFGSQFGSQTKQQQQ